MVFRDNVELYTKKRVSDGYGGHEEKEIFLNNINCKISSMTTQKQNLYFGAISTTALSLITKDKVDESNLIKIDNRFYKIIRLSRAFNKYILDLEIENV